MEVVAPIYIRMVLNFAHKGSQAMKNWIVQTATYVFQATVQQDANILQSGWIQRFPVCGEVADGR